MDIDKFIKFKSSEEVELYPCNYVKKMSQNFYHSVPVWLLLRKTRLRNVGINLQTLVHSRAYMMHQPKLIDLFVSSTSL